MTDTISAAAPTSGAEPFSLRKTGVLVLADGTVFEGQAFGATGDRKSTRLNSSH